MGPAPLLPFLREAVSETACDPPPNERPLPVRVLGHKQQEWTLAHLLRSGIYWTDTQCLTESTGSLEKPTQKAKQRRPSAQPAWVTGSQSGDGQGAASFEATPCHQSHPSILLSPLSSCRSAHLPTNSRPGTYFQSARRQAFRPSCQGEGRSGVRRSLLGAGGEAALLGFVPCLLAPNPTSPSSLPIPVVRQMALEYTAHGHDDTRRWWGDKGKSKPWLLFPKNSGITAREGGLCSHDEVGDRCMSHA